MGQDEKMAAPNPLIKAILICDHIITEAGSNKKSLIGVFENITAPKFPYFHPLMSVYLKLTDAAGEYKMKIELVDLRENKVIGKGEVPRVTFPDRLTHYELTFNFAGLRLHHPGKYEFRIYANEEFLDSKDFNVFQAKKKPS